MYTLIRVALIVAWLTSGLTGQASQHKVASPNGQIVLSVEVGEAVQWTVSSRGTPLLADSTISMTLADGRVLGKQPRVIKATTTSIDEMITVPVPTKSATLHHHGNELTLELEGGYSLVFRAYDIGVAYRFVTSLEGTIRVKSEEASFCFAQKCKTLFPEEKTMRSHYERNYLDLELASIAKGRFASLPVLIFPESGEKVLLTEADLYDYPNLFLVGTGDDALQSQFTHKVLAGYIRGGDPKEDRLADYLAETEGTRTYPWRVAMIFNEDKELLENDLVYMLARPRELEDTSWIKPGKVAWDWYNDNNIYGVDFRAGINTATYKYYIDFAAKFGIEYIVLDEGWSPTHYDLLESADGMDVSELIAYGKERGVDIVLWVNWHGLDQDMDSILATWAEWGVAGIKIDFMSRSDQDIVNFYQRVASATAKHKLLLDIHSAYKPIGLRRAYPNVLSYEGVKGAEHQKWSADITPKHCLTIPFIRMAVGPMDFTPGAMVNANRKDYHISRQRPMSLGTRCLQAAMYVAYESPLQMLCDSPSKYLAEPEYTAFIASLPTTWEETKALEAKIGDHLVIARRNGETWYVAAMTNWKKRNLKVNLSFLDEGEYELSFLEDGINADRYASDYQLGTKDVRSSKTLNISLAPGGGWVGIFKKK